MYKIDLKDFISSHNGSQTKNRKPCGHLCYIRKEIKDKCLFVASNKIETSPGNVEIFSISYEDIGICGIYKPPKCHDQFKNEFLEVLLPFKNKFKNTFILRDFNLNYASSVVKNSMISILEQLNIHKVPMNSITTTDTNTEIDWLLSKEPNSNLKLEWGVHESYFSFHKHLWLYFKKYYSFLERFYINMKMLPEVGDKIDVQINKSNVPTNEDMMMHIDSEPEEMGCDTRTEIISTSQNDNSKSNTQFSISKYC